MDKSGVVRKAPAGASACKNLGLGSPASALKKDQMRRGAPPAGSVAPDIGMNTNAVSHAGEPKPKGQKL